jgi:hypothetical protein
MPDLVADYGGQRRVPMRLGPNVNKSGASADIHRIIGQPGIVAKMYRLASDKCQYEGKVEEMLRHPPAIRPIRQNGRDYVQIAWPIATLRDQSGAFQGFIMPEIDMNAATELENVLQKSVRRSRGLPEFYGNRVLLAANLAGVMAELHKLSHYFIDMKPVNMRFYPDTNFLAVLDTDGFSIGGSRRWPARQFSDQYIPPEAKNASPSQLGIEADLFALAVIVFQLMNNGIHPFQGIDRSGGLPTSIQDRIYSGLYAYGLKRFGPAAPARMSVHDYFDPSTRAMFDRAFTGAPALRPPANEWNDHLKMLIMRNILVKCALHPTEHAHFGKGCGFCALDAKLTRQIPVHPLPAPPLPAQALPAQPVRARAHPGRRVMICAGIAGTALLFWTLLGRDHSGTIPATAQSYRGKINGNIEVVLKLHRTGFANDGKADLRGSYVYTRYNRPVAVTGYVTRTGRFEFQGRDRGKLIDNFSGRVASDGSLSGDYTRQYDGAHMAFLFQAE